MWDLYIYRQMPPPEEDAYAVILMLYHAIIYMPNFAADTQLLYTMLQPYPKPSKLQLVSKKMTSNIQFRRESMHPFSSFSTGLPH